MSLAFRLKMAKQRGEQVARENGFTALAVDPFHIAAKHEIEVRPKNDTASGVSGMLLRHGNEFVIVYATYVDNEGFQRFSVSHELGHYFLDGHVDHILPDHDGIHASYAGFTSTNPYELEADQFAAGLLMPAEFFKPALRRRAPSLDTIEAMAKLSKTSLTSTAIRCAELSDDALAIVISTGPTIDFCFMSDAMKSLPKLSWLRKGTPIPANVLTARFNAKRESVLGADRAAEDVNVVDWLGGTVSKTITEEVIGLGTYGKTLTVLSSTSIGQEEPDEDDEDQDLVESWTPRFRRR